MQERVCAHPRQRRTYDLQNGYTSALPRREPSSRGGTQEKHRRCALEHGLPADHAGYAKLRRAMMTMTDDARPTTVSPMTRLRIQPTRFHKARTINAPITART